MSIAILVCFGITIALNILKIILEKREIKKMNIKEFERKVKYYCGKKDGKGLMSFVSRNFIFVLSHKKQVAEILRAYDDNCDKNHSEV